MNNPHPEIVNKQPKVLIIGYGWVGQYVGSYFSEAWIVDKEGIILSQDFSETSYPAHFDLAFICVPTPMKDDGSCDISIVEEVVQKYKDRVDNFCIKSTVEVGTTSYLAANYGVNICMSPEYLGETVGHPMNEPSRETFIVLGGPDEVVEKFAEAWTLVTNSYTKFYFTHAEAAELVKLMVNSFIATKVTFMNEFYRVCKSLDLDWNKVREIFLADPRISRSHTYVYPNNPGFGGKCLEKDINNLLYFAKTNDKESYPKLLEFILQRNKEIKGVSAK